ncbi:MAG: DUF4301 family protein [Rikenellaceae bacterium]
MFTEKDLEQIADHGLSVEQVEGQIRSFVEGFPPLKIARAARVGDGIISLSEAQRDLFAAYYNDCASKIKAVKFVPASGAATRMFKELFEFVGGAERSKGIDRLLDNIENFAFYGELKSMLAEGASDRDIVRAIIGDEGLGYGQKPKALVSFHNYDDGARKAVEEHLVEGALYAAGDGTARIHFTVSAEHQAGFESIIEQRKSHYEQLFGVKYEISYSTQQSSTDTIAVNPDNTPFRGEDGSLLFRPAGHGALLNNIASIDADLIFVKTIDNVTTDERRGDTLVYKRALGGLLLELQANCFAYLEGLRSGKPVAAAAAEFIKRQLLYKLPESYTDGDLIEILNRPIRLCGVVRNEGEPGGGPFWVAGEDGSESLQIAESSQIAAEQMSLMSEATHFNPVDLVCGVRNIEGKLFDLSEYVDPMTGFISEKSSGGRPLRAQELPGLWNGAMANWNTIFVEVPITTFSPVKVVQDLLRPQHQ